jgi:tetratricopeptide (TPR) repeat protein
MLGEFHFRKRENLDKPGDWLERARGYYRQALELDPGLARAHVGIAKTFLPLLWSLRADSFDESMEQAQRAIDTALRLDPELGEAYTVLARIRYNRFDHVGVAAAANRALELNRNDTDAMYYLAQAEENQGHFTAALEIYRRQLELDPLNADLVQSVADRLAQLGHRDEAVAALAGYFGADSGDAWPLSSIALTYGQYDEAVRIAEQQPDYLFRAAQLAHAWARLGEAELAEAWYRQARERRSYGYIIPMPGVLIRLGKYDELVSMTREAMETQAMPRHEMLSPAQYRLLTVAALAQSLTGNYAEAVRYWEWRLENDQVALLAQPEEHVTALTFLAYAYRELGDTARSEALLSDALDIATNAEQQGVNGYPPLTIAVARLHALRGERDLAIGGLDAAIEQGWRDYYGEADLPMWQSLASDAEYRNRLARVRDDLKTMSERARTNGWARYPEQTG